MAVPSPSVDTNDYDDLASSPPMLQRLTHGAATNVSTNLVPPKSGRMCEGATTGRELSATVEGRQAQRHSDLTVLMRSSPALEAPVDEGEVSPVCSGTQPYGFVAEGHCDAKHTGQGEVPESSPPCGGEEASSGEATPPGRPWRNTSTKNDVGYLKLSPAERPPCGGSTEQRPEDARRATARVVVEEESLLHGEVGDRSRDLERSHTPPFKNNNTNTPWCRSPNPKSMPLEEAPGKPRHRWAAERAVAETGLEETLVHRPETRQGDGRRRKLHGASVQYLARAHSAPYVGCNDNDRTSGSSFQPRSYDNMRHASDEGTYPGQGVMGSGQVAWPPSPPSVSSGSGTASNSPPRHRPTLEERRARSFSVNHRSASFVERQELERLVKEHRREELARAEEEARRKLASEGWRMNRNSRAILARSSSSFCEGGGGRSSTARHGAGGRSSSVFERLARCASEPPFTEGADGYNDGTVDEECTRQTWGGGGCGVSCDRQPFTPTINARSSLLAMKMPRLEEDGFSQEERLYREGEEKLRRRERKIQLAEEALKRRMNSRHVNPGSERVLARRSRSKILKFRSRMRQVLEVVDARQTGWLSFAGLESVLGECEMLPAQQEGYDDILLGVWTALSEENPCSGGGGSRGGGGDDGCEERGEVDQDEREGACGVPIDSLTALLTGVAAESYGCGWTDSVDNNFDDVPWSRAEGARVEWKSLPSRPANRRLWGGGEGQQGKRAPGPGEVLTAMLQGNEQLEDLSDQLRDVFDTNRRRRRAYAASELRGPTALGAAGRSTLASTMVVSPAQVAATTARFEEHIRAKERKMELLRKAEEAREKLSHPFEPSMATTATPKAAAVRRKAAASVERKKERIVPSVECGDGSSRIAEGLQTKTPDLRTTEEREVEEKCTFQPRLFQPLPISPPRYPAPRTTRRSVGVGGESSVPDSADEAQQRIAVDRATASWYAQINRLKAGRQDRLRRLEKKQAIASRSEPLPPSVQQLFLDAGIEIHLHDELNDPGGQRRASVSAEKKGASSHQIAQKKRDTQPTLSRSPFASPPRLRLEARLRARSRLKEKRSQDQARKTAEEDARRQKRKRVLTRACKRSAAVAGLEMALAAREAERGLPSWRDPPILIAEVEFVRQKCWVFLPLWADTRLGEAVGELAEKQRGGVVGSVVDELERSLADELQRACEQTRGEVGLGRGQEAGKGAFGGGKARRDGDNRRSVPTVVIQVDVADTPLPETAAG